MVIFHSEGALGCIRYRFCGSFCFRTIKTGKEVTTGLVGWRQLNVTVSCFTHARSVQEPNRTFRSLKIIRRYYPGHRGLDTVGSMASGGMETYPQWSHPFSYG
jgi:hypothetical protein